MYNFLNFLSEKNLQYLFDNLKDYELEKADFIAETHLDNECDCGFLYPCGAEDCIFGQLVNGEITIKDFAIYIKEICNEDIDL